MKSRKKMEIMYFFFYSSYHNLVVMIINLQFGRHFKLGLSLPKKKIN